METVKRKYKHSDVIMFTSSSTIRRCWCSSPTFLNIFHSAVVELTNPTNNFSYHINVGEVNTHH